MLPLQAAMQHAPRLPNSAPRTPARSRSPTKRACGAFSRRPASTTSRCAGRSRARHRRRPGARDAVARALEIGPASRALEGQPEVLRAAAVAEIRAALAPLERGPSVPLGAAIWIVEARQSLTADRGAAGRFPFSGVSSRSGRQNGIDQGHSKIIGNASR